MAAEITATFLHFSQPPFPPSTSLPHKTPSFSFSFSINGPDRSIAHRTAHDSRSFYRSHRRSCVRASSSAMNRDKDEEFVKRIDEFASIVEMEAESRMNRDADSSNNDGELYASSSSPVSDSESPSLYYNTSETESMRLDKIDVRINCFDLPLSLRILKQKKKQQKSMDLTDSAYSAVKKAFSSMVFIVRELQSHTIRMRDALFSSSSNIQIHGILARVHEEVQSSFVWLFQHIFSSTPTLMVYLMLLLANFTVFSITDYPASAKTLTQSVSASVEEYRNPRTSFDSSAVKSFSDGGRSAAVGGSGGSGGGNQVKPVSGAADDGSKFSSHNSRTISPVSEKKQDDEKAWKGIIEEADRIRAIERHEALMDLDTLRRFVSPVRVEIEEDDLSAYAATDLSYRRALAEGFDDPLILCNFAQFLYVVLRDHDRAEEYFKRAALAEPADPEALSRYANFLWLARNDLEAAEETFLEAIAADPGNSYHSANYAHFLWSTGGEDTCYPLDPCDS